MQLLRPHGTILFISSNIELSIFNSQCININRSSMIVEKDKNNLNPVYSDADIVGRCNAGDTDAFGILMSRHEGSLRRKIYRFGIRQPITEDIEQEVWIRAFQKLGDLRDGASFKAWLMQVADTTCLGHIRRDKRRDALVPIVDVDLASVEVTASGIGDPIKDLATFTGLLVDLPAQYSEVIMLRCMEQLSLEEIAVQTGLTLSGVKWRLKQAKKLLREAMEEMSGQHTDETAVEQLIHTAFNAAQASRWEEAIEAYEIAARKADLDWRSLADLGRIYERQGDFHRAIKLIEKALKMNNWPWLCVVLGWCYDGLGEREKAVAIYEEILRGGNAGPWVAGAALLGMKAPHKRRRSEPKPVKNEREVPRHGWSVKTNHNPDEAHLAIDGDLMTRWTSQAPQDHNMYFELDLGKAWPVTRVVFDDDGNGQCIWVADCPHGYVIETSVDRKNWKQVASGSANVDEYAGAAMDGTPVRYIRIRLTERFIPNWWCIYEIRVNAL